MDLFMMPKELDQLIKLAAVCIPAMSMIGMVIKFGLNLFLNKY